VALVSAGASQVEITGVSSPAITNVNTGDAGSWMTLVFSEQTKRIRLAARGLSRLELATMVDGPYITVWPGAYLEFENVSNVPNLYVRASKSGDVVEILSWS
jgi:hypothetical protein